MKTFKTNIDWESGEPFSIAGFRPNGEPWSEEFKCLPTLPPSVLDTATRAASGFQAGKLAYIPEICGTIRACLVHSDQPRWDAMIIDNDRLIDPDDLIEIMRWLLETLTGRPFAKPSPSTPGGAPSTAISTGGSFSPVSPAETLTLDAG